ncbi:hypothetical protein MNB_SV-5-544 [hydrothermal vent metagenome]|uniref:Bacterial surface antigen (D15) domain-containing protein n=1 Tax=hydrothermal vent metagenome TaxID=652676 RepID=A0A1W1EC17_9ZZZZ
MTYSKKKKQILLTCFSTVFLLANTLHAEEKNFLETSSEDINTSNIKDMIIIPYVFSAESTGFVGGFGVIKQGLLQPQTTLVAVVSYGVEQDIMINGKEDTANFSGGFIAFENYKLPFTNRFFFSLIGLKSYFPNARHFLDGSNSSNKNDTFVTPGASDFLFTTFRYVLPIGEGLDNPEGIYNLKNGFAMGREGYGGGVPFTTGRTSLGIKTFYEHDEFENNIKIKNHLTKWDTNGLRYFVQHDNTDYENNPSRGYHFMLQYSKDYGKGDSLNSWDFLEFKYNHYINLPTFSWTQQNVLALSAWTGYSFSWENAENTTTGLNGHRPPPWEGARLGGFNRMRGYENNRFSDKAVFYATAEYRAILDWNPLRKNEYMPVPVDWFQVVAFAEAGRVHDTYDFELLKDMKYDVGLSLRAMAAEVPVRFDIAYGSEGVNFWLMAYQPFDF